MPQLGKAYIEVHADLSAFPAELREQLKRALKEGTAGLSFSEVEEKAEKAGENAAEAIGTGMKKKSKSGSSRKAGEQVADDIGVGLFGALKRLFSRTGNNGSQGFFKDIGNLFSTVGTGASDAAKQVQSFGEKVGEIGGKIGSTFSAIGSGVQGIFYALLVPAVAAGISLLVQLAGALLALPAAIALVLAAVAPLVIAFQGLGGAIAAGFSGDPKKFADALKGLAPAARSVVKEIVGLKSAFDGIKNSVQQAFFAPLVGVFKQVGGTLLPVLKAGLTQAAGALGQFAAAFLQAFSDPKVIAAITATFSTLAAIIADITPTAIELFTSVFGLIKTGLPFVQKFADYLAVAAQKFVDFLDAANQSGKIGQLIQDASQPFGELIKLIGVVGDLFFTIFANPAIKAASNDFLNSLIKAVGLLDQFFHSAEGQKVLVDFANTIKRAGLVLIAFAGIIIGLLEALHYTEVGLKTAGKAVLAFFQAIGQGAVDVAKAIGGFFVSLGSAIGDFFTKTLPGWFSAIGDFFTSLPKKAGDGVSSLRSTVSKAISDFFSFLFNSITEGFGRMIGFILGLPYFISQGFQALVSTIWSLLTSAFTAAGNILQTQFQATLHLIAGVRDGIEHFFVEIYHAIVDNAVNAAKDAYRFFVDGFNSLISFFGSLPGRVEALGPKLFNAAKSLGHAIGDGLKDIGNFAKDVGNDIVHTVVHGINDVIDGINRGIGQIGRLIPGGLPQIPHLAKGGVVDSPTVALIGERGPEVVVPLSDPGRAAQVARESGLAAMLARGASAPIVNVTAILGTGQILDILDTRIEAALNGQGAELAYART